MIASETAQVSEAFTLDILLSFAIFPTPIALGHYMTINVILRMHEHQFHIADSSIRRNHCCRNYTVQIRIDSMMRLSKSTLTGTSHLMFHTLRIDGADNYGTLHEESCRHNLWGGHIEDNLDLYISFDHRDHTHQQDMAPVFHSKPVIDLAGPSS